MPLMKRLQWKLFWHLRNSLGTYDQAWDTRTHGKGGLRMIYKEHLKDQHWKEMTAEIQQQYKGA
jgi:hypothetical protein